MARANRILAAGVLVALLALPGCATTDNPAEGGLFGGLYGMSSGAYDRRVAARQTRLDGVQRTAQALTVNSHRLEDQAEDAAARRRALRGQLASLEARTAELSARTGRMRVDTEAGRQRRAELEARLGQLRGDLDRLRREVEEKRGSAEAAEREQQALQAEMEELMKVANALR